jgi:IS5 family transposase
VIADRISFRRFARLSLHDHTPDHNTLWRFRQALARDGLVDQVFAVITRQLEAKNLVLKSGTLIDATLVAARASIAQAAGKWTKPCADPTPVGVAKSRRASSATRSILALMPTTPLSVASISPMVRLRTPNRQMA